MRYRKSLALLIILLLGAFLVGCSNVTNTDQEEEQANEPEQEEAVEEEPEEEPEPSEPEVIENEITISAVGDMLIHERVYDDARTEDGFDFVPMLEDVEPFLNDSTITFANQETMIGGEEIGLSTYPAFNSPTEVGDALRAVGVDVVSIANNHTLDRGEQAIMNSLDHWDKINMMYVGSYRDEEDRKTLRVYETEEGIDVAFLAYTYGTNGIPVPDSKDYLVNLIDQEIMMADIAEAKEQSDIVILSLHFGDEYERLPNQEQKDLVQLAADLGVDAVLGHHPHVLQPMEWVEGKDGHKTLAIYSLGNFLSGQEEYYRQVGGILKFKFKQTIIEDEETIELIEPQFMPTFVTAHSGYKYKVLPMYQLTDAELPDAANLYNEIKEHMSQWLPELEFMEP